MKNPIAHILTVPALFLAVSSARADVTVPLKNFEAGRFEFAEIFRPGDLTGTLTGVSAFVSLNDTRTFTFAQDLAVYVVAGDLGQGVAQAGGFTPLVADNYELWPDGVRSICNALRQCTAMLRVADIEGPGEGDR